jgi:hypothetical protein
MDSKVVTTDKTGDKKISSVKMRGTEGQRRVIEAEAK